MHPPCTIWCSFWVSFGRTWMVCLQTRPLRHVHLSDVEFELFVLSVIIINYLCFPKLSPCIAEQQLSADIHHFDSRLLGSTWSLFMKQSLKESLSDNTGEEIKWEDFDHVVNKGAVYTEIKSTENGTIFLAIWLVLYTLTTFWGSGKAHVINVGYWVILLKCNQYSCRGNWQRCILWKRWHYSPIWHICYHWITVVVRAEI